jgi:hypothetical protein
MRPFRRKPRRSLCVPAVLGLLVARDANDDLGVVRRQVIGPQIEAVSVGVSRHGSDRLPEQRARGR